MRRDSDRTAPHAPSGDSQPAGPSVPCGEHLLRPSARCVRLVLHQTVPQPHRNSRCNRRPGGRLRPQWSPSSSGNTAVCSTRSAAARRPPPCGNAKRSADIGVFSTHPAHRSTRTRRLMTRCRNAGAFVPGRAGCWLSGSSLRPHPEEQAVQRWDVVVLSRPRRASVLQGHMRGVPAREGTASSTFQHRLQLSLRRSGGSSPIEPPVLAAVPSAPFEETRPAV